MDSGVVVFDLFDSECYAISLCNSLGFTLGEMHIHQFPDEEIMVQIESPVKDRSVIFVASTDRPNAKIASLVFASETARELGAKKIGLIAPYLAYMRQDKKFHEGEGITSKYFMRMLSTYFDWVLTIDPHLHRWHSLDEVFTIPTILLHAATNIACWIRENIPNPVLIGPDVESQQWVAEIAQVANAPYLIVNKERFGDASVKATIPQIEAYRDHTPVVIDDIISTASTMIETINHLKSLGSKKIHCIGVHALFANNAYENLLATGIADVATCNTIKHQTNKIDLTDIIIGAISKESALVN